MKKLLIIIVLLLLSLAIVSGEQEVYVKNGDVKDLVITCTNNGTFCDDTISANITVTAPNSSIIVNNEVMTKNGAVFNYTLTGLQTTLNGDYLVVPSFFSSNRAFTKSLVFTVTPSGTQPNTAQAIIYAVLMLLGLLIAVGSIVWAINLDGRNSYSKPYGVLHEINYWKYFKIFLVGFAYTMCIVCLFLAWMISDNILWLTFMSGVLKNLFFILLYVTYPLALVGGIIVVAKLATEDFKDLKLSKRGVGRR